MSDEPTTLAVYLTPAQVDDLRRWLGKAVDGGVSLRQEAANEGRRIIAALDAAPAPTEDRWDFDTHPGDCHPRREPDVTWTVCCRECAGTGVFPVPWINSPAEGRADMDRCSDVRCKGTGRAVIGLAAPAPTDNQRDDGLAERVRAACDELTSEADLHSEQLMEFEDGYTEGMKDAATRLRAVVDGPTSSIKGSEPTP